MRAFIFECSTNTYREYVERQLFGSHLGWPLEVRTGDLCFLYHHGVSELCGIWRAEHAGHNLVPEAWAGRFPFQVKVSSSTPHILEMPLKEVEDLVLSSEARKPKHTIEGEALAELLRRFRAWAERALC